MNNDKPKIIVLGLLCVGVSFAVYWRTLAPTVFTFDSAEFATGAYTLGITHATGYPFYLLLAKLFTLLAIGDVAYRVNLMSAVWGAVTIGLLYLICYRITARVWLSAAVALCSAFSYYYWREAVIAETATLNTTLISLLILLLLSPSEHWYPKTMALSGLILGLSFANHMSTILTIPAIVYWGVVNRERMQPWPKAIAIFSLFVLFGLLFYLYLPIRYVADPPLNYAKMYFDVDLTTPGGLWSWITAEMFRPYMVAHDGLAILDETVKYLTWLWTNFLGAGVLIGIIGLVQMLRRDPRQFVFFALLYAAYTLFFINYRVVDKDRMFSVSYLLWAIWLAYGVLAIDAWFGAQRMRGGVASAFVAILALVTLVLNYPFADQSSNRMASEFAGQLLQNARPAAFIVTEWTWATPLEYYQIVENRRPDVTVFDRGLAGLAVWNRLRERGIPDSLALERITQSLAERIQSEIARRPVYATEYDDALTRWFVFIPENRYYRLEPRPGALP
ncbi:MAG: hypothetical protein A2Z03_08540 [Chloroflexi bacterium RBG_16_56_8]|nr:MAG: hypothetical protein A2Z03_08540 [Chloroflexi bacterium RBG_16_56_8]